MSTSITFPLPDGATYIIPAVDDENWGQNVTNFLLAIPAGVPPRNGTFSLTGDLSFGPSFGLGSQYFKSLTANIASTGAVRLAKTDTIDWRNNANSANLALAVNGSDQLTFNGFVIQTTATGGITALTGDVTATGPGSTVATLATVNGSVGSFTNANITVNAKGLITAASNGSTSGVTSITGTANQVIASSSTGAVTLSLPQSIATTSAPTFGGLTISGGTITTPLTASSIVATNGSSVLTTLPDPLPVAHGGTGDSSLTAYSVLCGGTTSTNPVQSVSGIGTTGQVLTSNGVAALPTWQTPSSGSGTVNAGTAGQLAYYASSGTAVDGAPFLALTFSSFLTFSVDQPVFNIHSTTTDVASLILENSNNKFTLQQSGSAANATFNITDSTNGRVPYSYTNGSGTPVTEIDSKLDVNSHKIINVSTATTTGDALSWGQAFTSGAITFSPTTTGIVGTTTNDNAGTGIVGEYVESVISTFTNYPTSTQYGDLTSISLTAGDWDVSITNDATLNASTATQMFLGISTTTGNSATGLVQGNNLLVYLPPTATSDSSCSIPVYRMSLSTTTTVYLKYRANYSAGTPQATGRISARRVR